MATKRKRSFDSVSTIPYSSSPVSTEPTYLDGTILSNTTCCSTSSAPLTLSDHVAPPYAYQHNSNGSPLPHERHQHSASGRTMKRHRDDQPDETEMYCKTLRALYEAQTRPEAFQMGQPLEEEQVSDHATTIAPTQSSLHAFWQLPRIVSSQKVPPQTRFRDTSNILQCQECDSILTRDEDQRMSMEVNELDIWAKSELACLKCLRRVCDLCAVLGE